MRVLAIVFFAVAILATVLQAQRYDRAIYEALLNDLEKEYVERDLAERVLAKRELFNANRLELTDRVRRASEKKSYPRNCYFSPIQCLFTRN